MLTVEGLQVTRGRTRVLTDLTLEVGAGEIAALIGSNGAGKTTTLMALSGLLPIAQGTATLRLDGQTFDLTRADPAKLVRAGLVHCPEGRQIFTRLTIEENLRLGAFLNRDEARVRALMDEIYALFPVLRERRHEAAGGLSGGEQMMLAIGRALMGEPRLLLLDEPSLGLAPQVTERIFDTLRDLNAERGVTLLLVEQNAMMALDIAHRGFVIREGRVELAGSGRDLLEDPHVMGAYLGLSA
ncbi:ABC transporter ATP-binding protein [Roseospira marina]|uniref:ABC transporter ATP-binding protein n=1 Tax=Roseospira marina TaxID=140057 RepID=A0A5M6ICZ1_9PROT|nr:ABC transporter ATP-binding protein [Roseospira marina]KAA5606144.1 ABC transporter ATP-binding protein [Roseospira marina]MBB4314283.1 branched-chain amino acid transport system ATP-binding protein [Roseospira marina]MBB5087443.1 branched-chain amino acid transport system ATP-binding protein [Roseospira marina]